MASLPVAIFQMAMSPYEDWHRLAWSGALLITMAVLALSITARVLEAAGAEMTMSATRTTRQGHDQEPRLLLRQPSALKDISLSIRRNKVTAIIGPSGCGKSTLLRVMNRIYELYPASARRRRSASSTARTSSRASRI